MRIGDSRTMSGSRVRGGLRLMVAVWTAGLVLGPAPLAAQSAPQATTNTPAADAVGPRELQNFSLSGTVTKPAEQAPQATAPATTTRAQKPTTASASTRSAAPTERRPAQTRPNSAPPVRTAATAPAQAAAPAPEPPRDTPASGSASFTPPSP